jgi:hypothetical protein
VSAASAVRRLFRRLDGRDREGFLASFAPGASIVHADGRAGSPKELWPQLGERPESRRLDAFREGARGPLTWVAYRNEVVFGGRPIRFSEKAVLRKAGRSWKFVRIEYARAR